MPKHIWIIATFSCILSLVFYIMWESQKKKQYEISSSLEKIPSSNPTIFSPPDSNQEAFLTTKEEASQNTTLYQSWFNKGQEYEKEGDFVHAIQCYHFALRYCLNQNLEKHIVLLEEKIQAEELSQEETWQRALDFEKKGFYKEALGLYEQLALHHPSSFPLQTKIAFSRHMLKMEEEQEELLSIAQNLIDQGKWDEAIEEFEKICILYRKWPEEKNESIKLKQGFQKADQTCRTLKKVWPIVKTYLQENRIVVAIQCVRQISSLPTKGMLHRLEIELEKEMAWVAEGPFIMGSDREPDERPIRTVMLAGYYIDRYEVTNRQYFAFIQKTGHPSPQFWENGRFLKDQEDYPVDGVSWEDAVEYARWVGKRLPTEAEWEKAARGSSGNIYPWGNTFSIEFCNCLESKNRGTVRVGSYPKGVSPYGCYDMAGNVLEWTADVYSMYPGNDNPSLTKSNHRVARGGAWYYPSQALYCSNRYAHLQSVRLKSIGFRCAWSSEKKTR